MPNPLLNLAAFTARILPAPLKRGLYKLGPLSRLIRASLNRAAPNEISAVTIAAGGLQGLTLSLNMQTEKDYWLGTYELDLQAAMKELVQRGMTAYDVGAHIGYISLLLGRAVGINGQVFCFEPLPGNLERLRANLDANPEVSQFSIKPLAVTDQVGEAKFLVHDSGEMGKTIGSAGRQISYSDTITVKSTSLDAFVFDQGHPAPDVIKMDIEGGEILALPGMTRLLNELHPVVLLELHGPQSAHAAWKTLTGAGYRLHRMGAGMPAVSSLDDLDWKAYLIALPYHA